MEGIRDVLVVDTSPGDVKNRGSFTMPRAQFPKKFEGNIYQSRYRADFMGKHLLMDPYRALFCLVLCGRFSATHLANDSKWQVPFSLFPPLPFPVFTPV